MFKDLIIKFLSKTRIYHLYIDYKYKFLNVFVSLKCKFENFCFNYLNYRPSKINLIIQRKSFGESIYDYVNALTNIKRFLDNSTRKYRSNQIDVYIIGNKTNQILDSWFLYNLEIFLENNFKKKETRAKTCSYFLHNQKVINIIYVKSKGMLLNKYKYTSSRGGVLGSYANRFDLFDNYKFLLKTKRFKSIEKFSKQSLPMRIYKKLKPIFSKKIIVFYDYDIQNRINRDHVSSDENQLKEDLYLRYFDNSIIKTTIRHLLDIDFYIIRLGRSSIKFPVKHKNFLDFAFDYSNTNFIDSLDFLIPYNANFCLTFGCGGHECSRLYGLPLFFVGYHRYDNLCNLENTMIISKKYYDSVSGNLIPLSKLINKNIIPYRKKYWDSRNIIIKSPSKIEINESLKEFLVYIKNIKNKDFSVLKNKKINSWIKFYLSINKNFKKYGNSENRYKKNFSVIISEYELKKYNDLFFK